MADVLVLCYHAVSERWPADLSVRPRDIADQLELLVRRGYRGSTFHAAVTAPPAPKTLAVTFDDAYRSVLELALPILSELGLPGTVFVPTDFADEDRALCWPGIDHWAGGSHDAELSVLSWAELERLAEAGWEVGSHTRTHPRLTTLDGAALAAELHASREACERGLGAPCRSLAYPYGDVDPTVVAATDAAGYTAAAALSGRLHRPTALEWPRIGVWRTDGLRRFQVKASPTIRRLRTAVEGRGR